MVVSLGGKAVKMRVKPGPEGMAQFRQQVRELFNIPADVEFECSFKCKAPSGDTIQLDGLASYEAATHCASLMAAQRAAAASRRAASAPPHAHRSVAQPEGITAAPDHPQQQQPQGPHSGHHHHHHLHHHHHHSPSAPHALSAAVPHQLQLQGQHQPQPQHQQQITV
ncbi:hypothetical protein PLESTB_001595800 [Pleodorina starrii]|uniref:Uncharacterized protein n=1 Tax=Pleodorina starrii TaxID=330485 RepID=A0A9W6F8I3_9CHLO|nr:hypothetical protein PLESTB_001595800 [Pleodorina starrii]GLC66060.1 hypothetical protein PLESTF_000377300 [Pleodorina starrii]GLC66062.1 hypothetical protein PLESTF_000377500 [Pleodorina starrii]